MNSSYFLTHFKTVNKYDTHFIKVSKVKIQLVGIHELLEAIL